MDNPGGEIEGKVGKMKAIDFLRQEHQTMLTGLYQEIERLQNQCTDMQRRLIFHGILPSNEEMLQERLSELDTQLAEKLQECESLRVDLEEKTKAIETLEEQLRQQEERYHEDVSARNLIVARLRKEVQEKANAVSRVIALLGSKPTRTELLVDPLLTAREFPLNSLREKTASKTPRHQSSQLCGRLMNCGPAGNQNLPSQSSSQPTLTISQQILDRYCRSSSALSTLQQNGNSTSTRTFTGGTVGTQCPPEVQLKHNNPDVDCMNNLQSWPSHLLSGKETTHV